MIEAEKQMPELKRDNESTQPPSLMPDFSKIKNVSDIKFTGVSDNNAMKDLLNYLKTNYTIDYSTILLYSRNQKNMDPQLQEKVELLLAKEESVKNDDKASKATS
jgi:hypothetical protein